MTPLQRRLAGVGRLLAAAALVLCAVVLALGVFRGQPLQLMIVTAITLVVAAVPESLPAVVTLSLALGARRMTARNAVIRRLPAVETLGSVTALATDKTGTLTEGETVLRQLWTPIGEAHVEGSGYAPHGEIRRDDTVVADGDVPDLSQLLRAAVLCNDGSLQPPDSDNPDWLPVGDPTEVALLTAAAKLGIDRETLHAQLPRIGEEPFDGVRKRMSTTHRLPDGTTRVVCKGAPKAVLQPAVLADPADLTALATAQADTLAADGYRVLAVAHADRTPSADSGSLEQGLTLLGLVAILDPPRTSTGATIAACQRAGITPVLITGDHPATAGAIAADLGIIGASDDVVDCRTADPGARAGQGAGLRPRDPAGADLKTLQDLLGHSNIVVTADTYTSVLPDSQRRCADATAALVLAAARHTRKRIKEKAAKNRPAGRDENKHLRRNGPPPRSEAAGHTAAGTRYVTKSDGTHVAPN